MRDKSFAMKLLRWCGYLLPTDYLKTTWYLYCVAKPRRALRTAFAGFYRMDHVYEVLTRARRDYEGKLTVLEFGTNEGYALNKMLYATKYLGLDDRVTVHGFDTFEGMPASDDKRDHNLARGGDQWLAGQFKGGHEKLDAYLAKRYSNYKLHKGLFEDTITPALLETLRSEPPVLVWMDSDLYSSTRTVFERLLPVLPNECVVYFDEYEFNRGSRFTGEARLVHEVNRGEFGDDVELVLDPKLSLDTRRVYYFMRFENEIRYEFSSPRVRDPGRSPTNGSPLP